VRLNREAEFRDRLSEGYQGRCGRVMCNMYAASLVRSALHGRPRRGIMPSSRSPWARRACEAGFQLRRSRYLNPYRGKPILLDRIAAISLACFGGAKSAQFTPPVPTGTQDSDSRYGLPLGECFVPRSEHDRSSCDRLQRLNPAIHLLAAQVAGPGTLAPPAAADRGGLGQKRHQLVIVH
jgi:hypothetical protein